MRNRSSALAIALGAMLALGLLATPATAASSRDQGRTWSGNAQLTLVHGVPGDNGFPVDISVYRLFSGSQVFPGVTFGTVAGPLDLKPGIYWVGIRPAGAPRYSQPVLSKWLYLGPGSNKSVVAHLTEGGAPTISVYRNDVTSTNGDARVTVRHDAAAPAVDILAGGSVLIPGLTNPNEASTVVKAGTYPIAVAPAGSSTPVFGPADLTFGADTLTIVYAVGDLAGGSFTPLIQTLPAA